jgi:hypothetical protein
VQIDSNTVIVCNFNNPLLPTDRSFRPPSKKKINRETSELNNTNGQMDLTDIYRILYPSAAEYTFFSSGYRTYFQSRSYFKP